MSKNIIIEEDSLDDNKTTVDLYNITDYFYVNRIGRDSVCVSLVFDNDNLELLAENILNHIVDVKERNGKHTSNREYKKESQRLRILTAN